MRKLAQIAGRVLAPLVCAVLLMGARPASAESDIVLDSGIDRPPYQQILDTLDQLAKSYPGWATVIDYGKSAEGRPLRAIELQDPSRIRGHRGPRPAVLISGATHGNEYLHIEDRLPGWAVANRTAGQGVARFFAAGGVLLVVPVVNPDGFANGTRENSRGQDLNRDFDLLPAGEPHFKESETRQLALWLDDELQSSRLVLKMTVDYHCCNGSLLNPWSYTAARLPAVDAPAFQAIGQLMQQDIDPGYLIGDTSQVLGYLARGTSKDYFYARYHAWAFTFEGRYGVEAGKFAGHARWWDHVLGRLAH